MTCSAFFVKHEKGLAKSKKSISADRCYRKSNKNQTGLEINQWFANFWSYTFDILSQPSFMNSTPTFLQKSFLHFRLFRRYVFSLGGGPSIFHHSNAFSIQASAY